MPVTEGQALSRLRSTAPKRSITPSAQAVLSGSFEQPLPALTQPEEGQEERQSRQNASSDQQLLQGADKAAARAKEHPGLVWGLLSGMFTAA